MAAASAANDGGRCAHMRHAHPRKPLACTRSRRKVRVACCASSLSSISASSAAAKRSRFVFSCRRATGIASPRRFLRRAPPPPAAEPPMPPRVLPALPPLPLETRPEGSIASVTSRSVQPLARSTESTSYVLPRLRSWGDSSSVTGSRRPRAAPLRPCPPPPPPPLPLPPPGLRCGVLGALAKLERRLKLRRLRMDELVVRRSELRLEGGSEGGSNNASPPPQQPPLVCRACWLFFAS